MPATMRLQLYKNCTLPGIFSENRVIPSSNSRLVVNLFYPGNVSLPTNGFYKKVFRYIVS